MEWEKEGAWKGANRIKGVLGRSGYNLSVSFATNYNSNNAFVTADWALWKAIRRYTVPPALWHIKSIELVDFVIRVAIDLAACFLLVRSCGMSWCWVDRLYWFVYKDTPLLKVYWDAHTNYVSKGRRLFHPLIFPEDTRQISVRFFSFVFSEYEKLRAYQRQYPQSVVHRSL